MLKRVSLGGRVRVWAENHRLSEFHAASCLFSLFFCFLFFLAQFFFEELIFSLAHGRVARVVYCGFLAVEAVQFPGLGPLGLFRLFGGPAGHGLLLAARAVVAGRASAVVARDAAVAPLQQILQRCASTACVSASLLRGTQSSDRISSA